MQSLKLQSNFRIADYTGVENQSVRDGISQRHAEAGGLKSALSSGRRPRRYGKRRRFEAITTIVVNSFCSAHSNQGPWPGFLTSPVPDSDRASREFLG